MAGDDAAYGLAPGTLAAWRKVEACESGGVPADGPTYYGLLGETMGAWNGYGGRQFAPTPYEASYEQQVVVGTRIEGGYIPDQGGTCSSW